MSITQVTNLNVTPSDNEKIAQLAERINLSDPNLAVSYGADTMQDISNFADSFLGEVRGKDAAPIYELLSNMLDKVRDLDVSVLIRKKGILAKLPLVGQVFDTAKQFIRQFDTVADQVNQISDKLDRCMSGLIRDVEMLDQFYTKNMQLHHDMTNYIAAGKLKLDEVRRTELPALKKAADESGDPMVAQKLRDFNDMTDRFEKRLSDLELSRAITLQTAPQVRLVQSNNQALAEKIQTGILTTIPVWKNQFVLAIALQRQQNAAKLQKQVTDTTNKLLVKNAELLETTSIATAREVERPIVDIETLKNVQNRLLHSIEETLKISQEGRRNRQVIEQELKKMEGELFDKLSSIAAAHNASIDKAVESRIAANGTEQK